MEAKPLKFSTGLKAMGPGPEGLCSDMFDARLIRSALYYLKDRIKERIRDEESRDIAIKAVDEAFPGFID